MGIKGERNNQGDFQLRPSLPPFSEMPDFAKTDVDSFALEKTIKDFSKIRQNQIALQLGDYKELSVSNETFAFARSYNTEKILVAVNTSTEGKEVSIGKNHWGYGENLLTGEKIQFGEKVFVPGNWIFVGKVDDCR